MGPAEMYKTLFYECYESSILDRAGYSSTSDVFGSASEDDEPRGVEAKAS